MRIKRVIIYDKCKGENTNQSYKNLKELEKYAKTNKEWKVVASVIGLERNESIQGIAVIKNADIILVKNMNRLAEETSQVLELASNLMIYGKEIIFVDEKISSVKPEFRLHCEIKKIFTDAYNEKLKEDRERYKKWQKERDIEEAERRILKSRKGCGVPQLYIAEIKESKK